MYIYFKYWNNQLQRIYAVINISTLRGAPVAKKCPYLLHLEHWALALTNRLKVRSIFKATLKASSTVYNSYEPMIL